MVLTRGIDCAFHDYTTTPSPRAVALVFHGLGAHGKFPTVRFAAEMLASEGCAVYAMDLPGHGESPGLRGYIGSADELVEDASAATAEARRRHPNLPLFLIGSSLGGALALSVSLRDDQPIAGVVLLAPLIAVKVSPAEATALWLLTWTPLARLALIPSSATSNEKQYADPSRREECTSDPLSYSGALRPSSAYACVDLAQRLRDSLDRITVPFLCLIAGADVV